MRARLEEFAAELFAPLPRADQRDKARTCVRGLLLDGRRKSMQPMGQRLGVDHQGLQQFLTSSTWEVVAVRRRLAARAVQVIAPAAWVVDDTGFVKDGSASPGVARQYSGSLGKVGNCQVGVSVSAVTDAGSCPLGWRLFLPESWDDLSPAIAADADRAGAVAARRARAGVPADQRHRPKWALALDMLDELAGWGLAPPVVAADAGYGSNAEFRAGIAERGWTYVVQVQGDLSAHAGGAAPEVISYSGLGPRPQPRYRTKPIGLKEHALAAGRDALERLTWRTGSLGPLTSSFLALRVRPAGRRAAKRLAGDGSLPAAWLLVEWPSDAAEPTNYWLSTLPQDTPLPDLSGWRRFAGGSNTTTANSRPASASTTSRAAPFPAGSATSPWSPPPSRSAPPCGPTQKRLLGPEPLRRPPRAPSPARHLDRHLHRLRTTQPDQTPSTHLTKHY